MSSLPPVERYSFSEVGRLTAEADEYLNSSRRRHGHHRRAKEVIEKLNTHISDQYLHQLVSVFGIHKKMGIAKDGGLHNYLKKGELEGLSEGFIVVDFDSDFSDVDTDLYPNQANLLANLQEFAPGRYAVSHLVKLFTIEGHSDDFLLQQTVIGRGFAPAFAAEIFPQEQSDIPEDSAILESERIQSLDSGLASRQLAFIEEQIRQTGDPLNVLVTHARKFRGLRPSEQYGFCRVMNSKVLNEVAGRRYLFNGGLPLYFTRQEDGTGSGPKSLDSACEIFVAGLDCGPHYEINWEARSGRVTDESALYLVGYIVDDGRFGSSPLVVPLEQLRGQEIMMRTEDPAGQNLYNYSNE